MRVDGAVKSLVHGVTTNNLVNADSKHFAEQVNSIPRVDEGLGKRPPAEYIAALGVPLLAGDFVKDFIIHDVAYFVIVRVATPSLEVYREDGVLFITTDVAQDSYLDNITEESLKIAVHGEIVFLLNKDKTVQMVTPSETTSQNSLLYIKAPIEQGGTIRVTAVNNLNVKVTKSIVVAATLLGTAPDTIAGQISNAFDADAAFSSIHAGAVVQFVRTDGEYSQVTVDADFGYGANIVVLNGTVNSFTDLPKFAFFGCRQSVKPADVSEGGEVFMKAVTESYKDEEDALGDPVAVWGGATHENLVFSWYTEAGQKLAGDAPQDGQTYNLMYVSADSGAISYVGPTGTHPIEYIRVVNQYGPTNNRTGYNQIKFVSTYEPWVFTTTFLRLSADGDAQNTVYTGGYETYAQFWVHAFASGTLPVYGVAYDGWLNKSAVVPSVSTALVEVKWIETAKTGVEIDIDTTTMPHVLQPTGSAFTYQGVNWWDRKAGDDETNPIPRFVTNKIEDLVVFQNRLTFLTNDEVVTSESGNVFAFFRDTVTQLLSKHPVNVRSTSTNSSKLRHFVYHNRDLLITASRQQYKLSGSVALTPQTASLELTTSYNASEVIKPVSIGKSVYLPNHNGEYLSLNKYDGSNRNLNPDSADNITQHVRKYISGTANSLAGLPNHGLIFAHSTTGDTLFVCNYDTEVTREEDNRFAWFKWDDFASDTAFTIKAIATVKNTLVLVIDSAQGLTMLKMDMDAGADKKYLDYQRQFDTVTTTIDVGTAYGVTEADLVMVQGTGCPSPGDEVYATSLIAGVITLDTDMTSGTVHVGREFNMYGLPNLMTIRDEGGYVQISANLRLHQFDVQLVNTGLMNATERSPYDTYDTQEFTGLVSGDLDSITDQEATVTATFKVGFKQKADVGTVLLHSKSWLPATITQIDWRGNYTKRGRRF